MNPFLENEIEDVPKDIAERIRQADELLEETGFWVVRKPTTDSDMDSPEWRAWLAQT